MYTEIEKLCASCVDCATKKTPRNFAKAPLQPIPVEGPFDRVAVDVLGPFPTSQRGNMYVVIFTDYFSNDLRHLLSRMLMLLPPPNYSLRRSCADIQLLVS